MPLILSHKHKDEIKAKVEEMLEFVGLADKMHQFPDELRVGRSNVLQLRVHLLPTLKNIIMR